MAVLQITIIIYLTNGTIVDVQTCNLDINDAKY